MNLKPGWEGAPSRCICHEFCLLIILKYKPIYNITQDIIEYNSLRKSLTKCNLKKFVIILVKYVGKMHENVFPGINCLENF